MEHIGNTLRTDTRLGSLCVELDATDPNCTYAYISIQRPDGEWIDLTCVAVDNLNPVITALLYGDTSTGIPTDSYTWTKEEINIE